MVHLDLEFFPVVIGASIYWLWRLLSVHLPSRDVAPRAAATPAPAPVEGKKNDEAIPASLQLGAGLEPSPEPGPEPSPEPSPDEDSATLSDVVAATSTPAPSSAQRRCSSLAAAVAVAVLAVLLGLWLLTGSTAAPLEQPVADAVAASPSQEQLLGKSEDGAGGQIVTLNLTRHQTTVMTANDVVYYKSAYWGTLLVGNPPEPFKVVFDTGSGHLILPSTYCHSETCRVHKRYSRTKSTSAKDIDYDGTAVKPGNSRDQITVSFGTGEVTGVFVEETVCMEDFHSLGKQPTDPQALPVAGASETENCMQLRIIAATAMSAEPFESFKFDGVLGLGLSGLSQAPEFNFLHVVAQSVKVWGGKRPNTFAVFLAEHDSEESAITLGGWAKEKMEHNLAWNPVYEPQLGHWLVSIKSMSVDGEPVTFCDDGTCRAVVDTGTSLMAVPSKSFPELFELLRHPSSEEGSCRGPGPKLHVELETITLSLEPSDYARLEEQKLQSTKRWPNLAVGPQNKTEAARTMYCKPMLMSMDLPEPLGPKLFILGEPWLRKYYTVYDSEAPARIGFALARHPEAPIKDPFDDSDESWFDDEEE